MFWMMSLSAILFRHCWAGENVCLSSRVRSDFAAISNVKGINQIEARVGGPQLVLDDDRDLAFELRGRVQFKRKQVDAWFVNQNGGLNPVLQESRCCRTHRLEENFVHVEAVLWIQEPLTERSAKQNSQTCLNILLI